MVTAPVRSNSISTRIHWAYVSVRVKIAYPRKNDGRRGQEHAAPFVLFRGALSGPGGEPRSGGEPKLAYEAQVS